MEPVGTTSSDSHSDSDSDKESDKESDVSSTYHSDGEVITSILHSSYDDSLGDVKDMNQELLEREKRQLEKFDIKTIGAGQTKGSSLSPQLPGLEQYLSADKFFIYTRSSFHSVIAECRGIPVPACVKYVSCIFSTKKPVFLLTVISNSNTSDQQVKQYKTRVARAITENVRRKAVSNFSVVSGIIPERECGDEKEIKARLQEFTTSTLLRTFPRSLEMNEVKCVAVIRCFLAMIGVEQYLSQGPSSIAKNEEVQSEVRDGHGESLGLSPNTPRFRHNRRQRHEQCYDPFSNPDPLTFSAHGTQEEHPMESSSLEQRNIYSRSRENQSPIGSTLRGDDFFPRGTSNSSMTDDDKVRSVELNVGDLREDESMRNEKPEIGSKWGPQKDQQWGEKEIKNVRDELLVKYRMQTKNNLKILLFGPTGQGKSSLGNSFMSGLGEDEHVSNTFSVGTAVSGGSVTTAFNPVKILGDSWLIDMPGIFETKAITDARIEDIASGKVPFYTELSKHLKRKGIHADPPPGKNDVACVVIVLNYDQEFGDEIRRQLDVIKRLAGKGVISYQLVLTHLDVCDRQFKDNDRLPNIYESELVQKAVERMAEEAGVPPYCISFVKNYVRETEKHPFTTLQHLRVLKKIVSAACDQTKKRQDMASMKKHYDDSYIYKYRVHIAVGLVLLAVLIMFMVSFGKS